MKLRFFFVLFFLFFIGFAQEGYPVPTKNKNHLFYIQHNSNHNTYVYDVNLKKNVLNAKEPIEVYRINYEKGGKREELSAIQRKFAYGVNFKPNSTSIFYLSASKNIPLTLKQQNQKYWIEVIVNNKKIRVEKIFIFIDKNTSGLNIKVDSFIIYGKTENGNSVVEKVRP